MCGQDLIFHSRRENKGRIITPNQHGKSAAGKDSSCEVTYSKVCFTGKVPFLHPVNSLSAVKKHEVYIEPI